MGSLLSSLLAEPAHLTLYISLRFLNQPEYVRLLTRCNGEADNQRALDVKRATVTLRRRAAGPKLMAMLRGSIEMGKHTISRRPESSRTKVCRRPFYPWPPMPPLKTLLTKPASTPRNPRKVLGRIPAKLLFLVRYVNVSKRGSWIPKDLLWIVCFDPQLHHHPTACHCVIRVAISACVKGVRAQ